MWVHWLSKPCTSGFARGTDRRRNGRRRRFAANQNSCWRSDNFMRRGLLGREMHLHRRQYAYNARADAGRVGGRCAGRWNYRDWRSAYRNNNSRNSEKKRTCVSACDLQFGFERSRVSESKNLDDLCFNPESIEGNAFEMIITYQMNLRLSYDIFLKIC